MKIFVVVNCPAVRSTLIYVNWAQEQTPVKGGPISITFIKLIPDLPAGSLVRRKN